LQRQAKTILQITSTTQQPPSGAAVRLPGTVAGMTQLDWKHLDLCDRQSGRVKSSEQYRLVGM